MSMGLLARTYSLVVLTAAVVLGFVVNQSHAQHWSSSNSSSLAVCSVVNNGSFAICEMQKKCSLCVAQPGCEFDLLSWNCLEMPTNGTDSSSTYQSTTSVKPVSTTDSGSTSGVCARTDRVCLRCYSSADLTNGRMPTCIGHNGCTCEPTCDLLASLQKYLHCQDNSNDNSSSNNNNHDYGRSDVPSVDSRVSLLWCVFFISSLLIVAIVCMKRKCIQDPPPYRAQMLNGEGATTSSENPGYTIVFTPGAFDRRPSRGSQNQLGLSLHSWRRDIQQAQAGLASSHGHVSLQALKLKQHLISRENGSVPVAIQACVESSTPAAQCSAQPQPTGPSRPTETEAVIEMQPLPMPATSPAHSRATDCQFIEESKEEHS